MAIIATKPLDVNKFWDKTPTPLKYLLLIAIIVGGSYFLVSKKVDHSQVKELTKIEQSIDVTYDLVKRFEAYQTTQNTYNTQTITDIKNVYELVQELNSNINTKIDYMIRSSGKYNQDLIDKLILLNQSFEKLSKAYEPIKNYDPQISVKKLEK
jgi:Tol biopolymer transport system component